MRRSTIGLLGALLAAFVCAQPAVAADRQWGTLGPHRITDTATKPGATCEYKGVVAGGDYYYAARLARLSVRPPKMKASTPGEYVGWQFWVDRSYTDASGYEHHTKTYTSPWQTTPGSTTRYATFSPMNVGVTLPRNSLGRRGQVDYHYEVFVYMVWYVNSGANDGWVTHQTQFHNHHDNNPYTGDQTFAIGDYCPGFYAGNFPPA